MRGRGNGLDAESYKPLTDLEPPEADVMLDALRAEGVAAYAAPIETADDEPDDDSGLERLWVDADATSQARTVLRAHREANRPPDDEVWAQLVANFDSEPPPRGDVPRPLPGNLTDARRVVPLPAPAPRDWEPPELEDDPDDHFTPPAPPPLPHTDLATKAGWVALLGGPLFLLVSVLMGHQVGGWTAVLAFGAFIGGFVMLVSRMRRDRDDDPDDGAIV